MFCLGRLATRPLLGALLPPVRGPGVLEQDLVGPLPLAREHPRVVGGLLAVDALHQQELSANSP